MLGCEGESVCTEDASVAIGVDVEGETICTSCVTTGGRTMSLGSGIFAVSDSGEVDDEPVSSNMCCARRRRAALLGVMHICALEGALDWDSSGSGGDGGEIRDDGGEGDERAVWKDPIELVLERRGEDVKGRRIGTGVITSSKSVSSLMKGVGRRSDVSNGNGG
jgi:hypothetical protein